MKKDINICYVQASTPQKNGNIRYCKQVPIKGIKWGGKGMTIGTKMCYTHVAPPPRKANIIHCKHILTKIK